MATEYFPWTTGKTLYAKPRPLVVAPWATDAVTGVENGTTGDYSFAVSAVEHAVFEQAGGTPASTDLKIGTIPALVSGGGGGSGDHQLTVIVQDTGAVRIPGSEVSILTAGGAQTGRTVTTDSNGEAVFNLDADNYQIRTTPPAGFAVPADQAFSIAADKSETVVCTPTTTPPSPSDPSLCVLVCVVYLNGNPVEGAKIKARVRDENSAVDGIVVSNAFEVGVTNASGRVDLELIRQDQFTDGNGIYEIRAEHDGNAVWRVETTIPNAPTANLEDLIS